MAATNKQQLLDKALTVLKKKFPAPPEPEKRAILEEVIYGICREGVPSAVADVAYANIKKAFFDWNEIRVSSVPEVEDVLGDMPQSGDRAKRIVGFLQEHFERTYSFELDELEKKGVKQAAKQLARYKDKGVSDFVVAWVTQRALGGHAIPLDEPTIRFLRRLHVIEGDIDDLEATRGSLEHFIPKAKGYDFTEETIQLAVTLCVEVPACKDCPLKADCPTGIENLAKKDKKADDKAKKAK
jgi:endonuclease III